MSIEQRLTSALEELEAMLTQGTEPEEALAICANDYELKREVLELRARKALGDLTAVRAKNLEKAERLTREHKADTAIERYLHGHPPDTNFPKWFERDVGRPPSEAEMDAFRERHMAFLVRNLRFEL
jgi:hypothetical protein